MPSPPRTANGRYPRGHETKQRIVCIAIDIFGRQGFAGTSTRDIAAGAHVNTPALHYYFGGKLGLYNACIDQLTEGVWQRISPAVTACQASVDAAAGIDDLIAALGDVQNCLIDSFFADREGQAIRRLLAWEDAENGENASHALMQERIGQPIFQTFRRVVDRVACAPLQGIDLDLHALSLMGLCMIFHFNQTKVMDMLDRPTVDESLIAMLKGVAHKQLSYALIGLSGRAATV